MILYIGILRSSEISSGARNTTSLRLSLCTSTVQDDYGTRLCSLNQYCEMLAILNTFLLHYTHIPQQLVIILCTLQKKMDHSITNPRIEGRLTFKFTWDWR